MSILIAFVLICATCWILFLIFAAIMKFCDWIGFDTKDWFND